MPRRFKGAEIEMVRPGYSGRPGRQLQLRSLSAHFSSACLPRPCPAGHNHKPNPDGALDDLCPLLSTVNLFYSRPLARISWHTAYLASHPMLCWHTSPWPSLSGFHDRSGWSTFVSIYLLVLNIGSLPANTPASFFEC